MWAVTVEIQSRVTHKMVPPAVLIISCFDEDNHLLCVCTSSVVEFTPITEL